MKTLVRGSPLTPLQRCPVAGIESDSVAEKKADALVVKSAWAAFGDAETMPLSKAGSQAASSKFAPKLWDLAMTWHKADEFEAHVSENKMTCDNCSRQIAKSPSGQLT